MNLLCWLGLHRWEYHSRSHTDLFGTTVWTMSRCRRDGCRRYPRWFYVDIERIPRFDPVDLSDELRSITVAPTEETGQSAS